jgi:hypothetical protein
MAADGTRAAALLRNLERCFLGVVPAVIATCSPEGIPNITFLSIVHGVDDSHLALSFQFFNKTRENILANPKAQILLIEPKKMEQYRIDVRYERTDYAGAVFERMRTNLDAVASQTGMAGVFHLQGADIYRVLRVEKLAHDLDLSETEAPADFVAGLEALSTRLAECDDLEALLDTTLKGLAELFDYQHTMILLADGAGQRLYTVASLGFAQSGVGAEIAFGQGLIGVAALKRQPVRVASLRIEQTMAEAVRATVRELGGAPIDSQREIPLPGLAGTQSQVAVPMLARDRVLGVLCVQSTQPGRLSMADEQILSTLARYLATSIQLLGQTSYGDGPAGRVYASRPTGDDAMRIRHHASDDSIFIDDEYLIKGLPGRIFFRLLGVYERDGRVDFTNKELRVDASLQLGGYRDNLEARLILLRRRLEERATGVWLTKTGRGRFRLELRRPFKLSAAP